MLTKFFSDKKNVTKTALFFPSAPIHHGFTFNLQFLYELKHMVHFSKTCVRFSNFDSVLFLLDFIFLFNKMHRLFDFKNIIILFKLKIREKPHIVLLPDLWFLYCHKKFENSIISAWVGASQKLTLRQNSKF